MASTTIKLNSRKRRFGIRCITPHDSMPRGADAQPECIHHIFIFLKHRPECARTRIQHFFVYPNSASPNFSSFLQVRHRTVLQCASPCCSFVFRNSRQAWCSAGGARVIYCFCWQCFPDCLSIESPPQETRMLRRSMAATCMLDRGSTATKRGSTASTNAVCVEFKTEILAQRKS